MPALVFAFATNSIAGGSFEFIFFGVNIESLQDSSWGEVVVGAVASLLVHELGHALYLQAKGKDWDLVTSRSGLSIQTSDPLSEKECLYLGRSGFLLQTGIGFLLTSFERTRQSDFTKGWVCMNVFQASTYSVREHDGGDDMAMIERGNGNGSSEMILFSTLSLYNTWRTFLPEYALFSAGPQFAGARHPEPEREGDQLSALGMSGKVHDLPASYALQRAGLSFAVGNGESSSVRWAELDEYQDPWSHIVQNNLSTQTNIPPVKSDNPLGDVVIAGM